MNVFDVLRPAQRILVTSAVAAVAVSGLLTGAAHPTAGHGPTVGPAKKEYAVAGPAKKEYAVTAPTKKEYVVAAPAKKEYVGPAKKEYAPVATQTA
jgi:hypothetical protein